MRLLSLILFLILTVISIPSVSAQERKSGIEVIPAYADIEILGTEQSKKIEITYINHNNTEVTLDLSALDFKQQGERGQIGFIGQETGAYSYSLSSFLSFESNQLVLDSGEKKSISVTINNRQDLSPGGHYAAVVAKVGTAGEGGGVTPVLPSLSSLLLIRKTGGERFNLSLVRSEWPKWFVSFSYPRSFELLFQNEGNIHVIPYGRIDVRDMVGRQVFQGSINPSSKIVFPEVRRYVDTEMRNVNWSLPVALNTVTIKGQDSTKKVEYSYANTFVYINPYFIGIVIVFGGFGVFMKRRKRKS